MARSDRDHYERLHELFAEACDLEADARREFLARECAHDPALREELSQLLNLDQREPQALEQPALGDQFKLSPGSSSGSTSSSEANRPSSSISEAVGDRIGPYKLLQQIGEGGFGLVYMAEQKQPIRRRVALKVIKLGMDTAQVLARFDAERQALALMDHPNIARVLDAGATDSGRPYFVMELVRGEAITDYCDRENLTTRVRLELFQDVCQAVQHAHQKGIIHRDLKPSNVLVSVADGQPIPKVIDFGIAKATNRDLTDRTLFTEFRQVIGTPAYMSPEQADPAGVDIDTRSDIYSLGVLLYELLTGTAPFSFPTQRGAAQGEFQRIIREVEPPRPSARLHSLISGGQKPSGDGSRDDPSSIDYIARHRHTEPSSLSKLLAGDVDWIVMKCLEKERGRRYDAASDLAMDLQRHLEHRPVLAGPPSATYRLRKFVRRNRMAVTMSGMVVVAVVLGLVGTGMGWTRAIDQRDRAILAETDAQRELGRANAVNALLDDMMGSANPHSGKPADYTVRQMLEDFDRSIEGKFEGQPRVEASIRETVGMAYLNLGLADQAEPHLRAALDLRLRELRPDHLLVIRSRYLLAELFHQREEFARAESVTRELLAIVEATPALASTRHSLILELAVMLSEQGHADEAEPLYLELLADRRDPSVLSNLAILYMDRQEFRAAEALLVEALAAYGDEDEVGVHTQDLMNTLGDCYGRQGRYQEAEPLLERALESNRRLRGPDDPKTLRVLNGLAQCVGFLGRLQDEHRLLRESVELHEQRYGRENAHTLQTMGLLAFSLRSMGDPLAAKELYLATLERQRSLLGPEEADVLTSAHQLAGAHADLGEFEAAEMLLQEVVEVRSRVFGEAERATLRAMHDLAGVYVGQGRLQRAQALHEKVLSMRLEALTEDDPDTMLSQANTASLASAMGRPADAERLFGQALEAARRVFPEDDPRTLVFLRRRATSLMLAGRLNEAEESFLECLSGQRRVLDADHPELLTTLQHLGDLYLMDMHRYAAAEGVLRELMEGRRRVSGDDSRLTKYAMGQLGDALSHLGRFEECRPLLEVALQAASTELGGDPTFANALRQHLLTTYEALDLPAEVRRLRREEMESLIDNARRANADAGTLNNAAWDLLTIDDQELRDSALALEFAQRANDLEGGQAAHVLDTLALALHRNGDTRRAIQTQTRALELLPEDAPGRSDYVDQLELYLASLDSSDEDSD